MVHAWRLVKTRHAATAFDGKGAMLYGARWNSRGVRVAYASDSEALAILEVFVHLKSWTVLASYSVVSLRIPKHLIEELPASLLPPRWRDSPPPPDLQAIGDRWAKAGRSAVLRVPSVVIPSSRNFLLNPEHPDFARIAMDPAEPFHPDPRLLKP
jgi:RES domain-containing protein